MHSGVAAVDTRIAELDGLRGVAVLLVVIYHFIVQRVYTLPGSLPAYLQKYFDFLWIGVDIFFVLSGYLVGGILIDQLHSKNGLRVFYLRRALRILPPYILLLLLFSITIRWSNAAPGSGMDWLMDGDFRFWIYMLFLQNILMTTTGNFGPLFVAPTWSLAIEEQFYLLFPLFLRWCRPTWLPAALVGLILAAPIFRAICFVIWPDSFMPRFVLLPMRWDSLLLGALAAWAVRKSIVWDWGMRRLGLLRAAFGFGCIVIAVVPLFGNMRSQPTLLNVALYHLLIAAMVALTIFLLRLGDLKNLKEILQIRALRFFGRISYSMYLFHMPVLGIVFWVGFGTHPVIRSMSDWLAIAGAFGLTVLTAQLTWWLFEARLIRFGHRFAYRSALPASTRQSLAR